jgi:hypothetical protein
MGESTWYVVVRPDNGYPVLVYPEKSRAELVARLNGYRIVPVQPIKSTEFVSVTRI